MAEMRDDASECSMICSQMITVESAQDLNGRDGGDAGISRIYWRYVFGDEAIRPKTDDKARAIDLALSIMRLPEWKKCETCHNFPASR